MIVQLDIQAAVGQRAGVGRYVQALASHLGAERGADEIRLFFFDFQRRGLSFAVPGATVRACRWMPGRLVQQAWKHVGGPPYDWFSGPAADLYHFPNFICPPLHRGHAVVTVHDLSFLRFPAATEKKNLAWLRARFQDTLDRADAVITDSAFGADELVHEARVSPGKVFPIPLGIPRDLRAPPAAAVRRFRSRLGLDRPYLLHVGTFEPRKNIPFLVEAFERMRGFDGDLVLAGMPGWKTGPIEERIRASTRADRIRRLNFVPDADLPALYAGAELFVFPSRYEGFGFPPLEAMACGTPVLSSRGGSLPEVLGDAAEILDVDDPDAWAHAAQRLMEDREIRAARQAAGRRQAARFDWAQTARRTWEVYRACR